MPRRDMPMEKKSYILGLTCYGHDAAAALLANGAVVMALEEERLNRKKHSGAFPAGAIHACLEAEGVGVGDLEHVGFSWHLPTVYRHAPIYALKYFHRVFGLIRESREWTLEEDLGGLKCLGKMRALPRTLRRLGGEQRKPGFRFHYLEHHMCHAASAFYPSPFDEAAIMTVDGAGEWTTAMLAAGRGTRIEKIATVDTPHSLGAFYNAIARYLGFDHLEGPGKLMGLASYGDRGAEEYRKLRSMIEFMDGGRFRLDMSYFSYHYTRRKRGVSDKFYRLMGPANTAASDWTDAQLNIAAAAQRIVEEAFLHMAHHLHVATRSRNLCVAGGVGLNSVANGRLVKESPFENFFIQPAAGDSGTSLGAALFIHHALLGRDRCGPMTDAFLGPGYPAERYAAALRHHDLARIESADYAAIAARLLGTGKIIGWFQGRMEFGPRALGNRSLLATPCLKGMKDILNTRVKFRESFRPFAAIVLEDRCGDYFDCSCPSPFMLQVYNVREDKREQLGAVTHVDGTARVQTVTRASNPEMYALLCAFEKETGVPVLLNTSFNIRGQPIVCSPEDAVACFTNTRIDFLVIGRYVVGKSQGDLELMRGLSP